MSESAKRFGMESGGAVASTDGLCGVCGSGLVLPVRRAIPITLLHCNHCGAEIPEGSALKFVDALIFIAMQGCEGGYQDCNCADHPSNMCVTEYCLPCFANAALKPHNDKLTDGAGANV